MKPRRTRVVFAIGAMHGGGSERQILTLLRGLDKERFEAHLYLVYRTGPLLDAVPDDVQIVAFEERCSTGGLYWPGRDYRCRVRDFASYLKEIEADVVYDRTFLMSLISAAGAQQVGVPNIATIVTDPNQGFAPVAGRFQWWKKRLLSKVYKQSSVVVANSQGSASSAEQFYGLPTGSVHVHHNGIDIEHLLQQSKTPVQDSWWNETEFHGTRLITAGRLNHEKGFHLLIDALAELAEKNSVGNFKLAILGEGRHHEILNDQIRSLGLQNSIRLMGFQTNAAAWYASADIFVLPSLLEGMPNVLLEAMAVGTAVISTDCRSGPKEILDSGRYGQLVEVGRADALASGIKQLIFQLRTPTLQSIIQHAQQHIQLNFSQQKSVQRFTDFVQTAIQKRR